MQGYVDLENRGNTLMVAGSPKYADVIEATAKRFRERPERERRRSPTPRSAGCTCDHETLALPAGGSLAKGAWLLATLHVLEVLVPAVAVSWWKRLLQTTSLHVRFLIPALQEVEPDNPGLTGGGFGGALQSGAAVR